MIYGIKRARLHAPWRTRTWAPATKSRWSIRRPRLERAWLFSAKSGGFQNEGARSIWSTTKISHQTSMVWLHPTPPPACKWQSTPPPPPNSVPVATGEAEQVPKPFRVSSLRQVMTCRVELPNMAKVGWKAPTLKLSVPGSREGVAIGYHSTCSLEAKLKKAPQRLSQHLAVLKKQLKFPSSLVSP